jgi:hypothetical protein
MHYVSKPSADRIFKIIAIVLFLSSFLTLAFLISVSQKGFDITDEGFHLLASQFPKEVEIWSNVAHIYTGLMFSLVGYSIIALRILSELMLFTSASFLFWGLLSLTSAIYPAMTRFYSFKIISWSMICLGALFYYIHFDTTPHYNTLNTILLNMTAGFLCFSLACLSAGKLKFAALNSFLAGISIGIILFAKFPTAISLTLLCTFILLIWPKISRNSRFLAIGMLALGISAWFLVHISFLQSWALFWHTIHNGIHIFLVIGLHSPTYCFQHYVPEISRMIANAFMDFWKIYLLFFIGVLVTYLLKRVISGAYFIILILLAGWNSMMLHFYRGGSINSMLLMEFYTGWLLLLLFFTLFTFIYQKKWGANKQLLVLSLLLLALPFAGAGGTANIITLNLTQYMAPWCGLMAILLLFLAYSYHNRWIFLSGAGVISAFACSQIISAGFIAPYKLNTTIQYQTVPTAIGFPATYLQLDPATSEFFAQIKQIAKSHGFKPGDDILSLCDTPGIVFALGGKSPVVPWYTTLPNAKIVNERILQQAPLARIKRAFIVQNENGAEAMPDLSKLGITFPADYVLCGQVIWPLTGEWVRLWKPKQL